MSQEKVDRHKKEKKNRAKTMRRQKVKKALAVFICSLGVGALIGIPLGKHIYKVQKEKADANRTIVSSEFDAWFEDHWKEKYGYEAASSTDAQYQDLLDQYNNASDTDAGEQVVE